MDAQYALDIFRSHCFQHCTVDFYAAGSGIEAVQKAPPPISLKGWVDKARLEEAYAQADMFLSIAEKDGQQISSKIFEYMSYGKPILHLYTAPQDCNLRYLRHYDQALCLHATAENLSQNRLLVALFLLGMRNRKPDPIRSDVLRSCTPAHIAQLLQRQLAQTPPPTQRENTTNETNRTGHLFQ